MAGGAELEVELPTAATAAHAARCSLRGWCGDRIDEDLPIDAELAPREPDGPAAASAVVDTSQRAEGGALKREDLSFVNIGNAAYGAIRDGRLVGVLFYAADEYDTEGTGEPEDARIWFFVAADDPLNPQGLQTPPLLPSMGADEVAANADEAMDAAFAWLDSRISGAQSSGLLTPEQAIVLLEREDDLQTDLDQERSEAADRRA